MVRATIRLLVPLKRRRETLEILSAVAERARFEPGCVSCRVYQGVEVENVVMLEGLWKEKENLERHLRSEEYRDVLLIAEMALEPPEIRFDEISSSTGIETIEKARNFPSRGLSGS